ncbi:MAG TPA: cytochrome c biogenesis heme-transporting ATPase CcmA [Steroidobacteraceae bacterium]|nr:cytochrome c biogenesis heme-transporting ATPase CcmA [Steroidobacteraceae bacterium]
MSERRLEAVDLHLWRGDRHVLRGLEFSLGGSECLQVTGSNGSGKTSLLRTLCGLMWPEQGRVLWGGSDIRRDMPAFHTDLAYIGHEPPLKADLTPRENLLYWAGIRRRLTGDEANDALSRVGAAAWGDRPVRTLSAGQKRRVALAGLMLLAAPLWLLDEPTTNLDAEGQQLVSSLIREQLARGGLVVAAVHHELTLAGSALRRLELAGG